MAKITPRDAQKRVFDLIIVGTGPAGVATAQASVDAGWSVLLVEEGGMALPSGGSSPDSEHEIPASSPHDPREKTNCIAVGGALHRWGGRCMPLDPEDFGPRQLTTEPGWPIDYDEYARWVEPAAEFLETDPLFATAPPPPWRGHRTFRADRVERLNDLGQLTRMQKYLCGPRLSLLTNIAIVELKMETNGAQAAVTGLAASDRFSVFELEAKRVVLACGGLETTRLLLQARQHHPRLFGGEDGPLGRYYMGHLTGSVASLKLCDVSDIEAFRYAEHGLASAGRRRIMLTTAKLPSAAFWLENSDIAKPDHRSGELSVKHLFTDSRFEKLGGHLRNICIDPKRAADAIAAALQKRRHPERRSPARLAAQAGDLRLAYHSEHLPLPNSRVFLAKARDRFGRPKLRINFEYGKASVDSIVAAHRVLANALANARLAHVKMVGDDLELRDQVIAQARDGYHQIGLTRMSADPAHGVVDTDCKLHDLKNLFIASGSIFPVSGQANPTLSVVAFALRLGAHLAKLPAEE